MSGLYIKNINLLTCVFMTLVSSTTMTYLCPAGRM